MGEKGKSWFRETFQTVLGVFGGWEFVKGILKTQTGNAADLVKDKVIQVIKDNPRVDLLYVLLSLPAKESKKLWERHRVAMREGKENDFVVELGHVIPKNEKGEIDMERAKRIFKQLANTDERLF
ncbi:MAG: hypothetical protein PHQ47_03985, partial [Candidatus Portnoybacteria bacterium]|nr:hypothetical protein [Candidatus Portnoybacteria bacterium]